MINVSRDKFENNAAVHCVALIGALHGFVAVLLCMIAFTKDPAMRKVSTCACVLSLTRPRVDSMEMFSLHASLPALSLRSVSLGST